MNKNKGIIITFVLVFVAIFMILLGGLVSFILAQLNQTAKREAYEQSLSASEAGVEYYKWCLNNEVEQECSTQKEYKDPEGNIIGDFTLDIEARTSCGEVMEREIVSVGRTDDFPETDRKIRVLYGKSSVAKYSYLLNDNVWAGSDREIRGTYHSNGGVRMDGENQSVITSNREEWVCTDSFGCSYSSCPEDCWTDNWECHCPGVFTTTGNSQPGLFDYPAPLFDFDGISVDLLAIKNAASSFGIYLPPSTGIDGRADGYHLNLLDDGTVEVWIITRLGRVWAYSLEEGWHYDYSVIQDEYLYDTYPVNSTCALVFVEDNLWLEGKIKGKVTIASADLADPNKTTGSVLVNDIDYDQEGVDGLALISQEDILISPDSPDQMELKGIFIAQHGHFGRHHYPENIRDKLEITGSVVSNGRVGTKWTSGSQILSGYLKRENYIDPSLIYSPPPFVSDTSLEFEILNWEELEE